MIRFLRAFLIISMLLFSSQQSTNALPMPEARELVPVIPMDSPIPTPPPKCEECAEDAATMGAVLDNLSYFVSRPNFLEYAANTDDSDSLSEAPATDIFEMCSMIARFKWEDESLPGSSGSSAFNCRDFSKWFRECLLRAGTPAGNAHIWTVRCQRCGSGQEHAHAVNLVLKDGNWCPWEPQWPPEKNGSEYGHCCSATQDGASDCLLKDYCGDRGQTDACCEPGKAEDGTSQYCNEQCRFVTSKDGQQQLVCDIPGIGNGQPFPIQTPYVPPTTSPCAEAQKNCLAANPTSCTACLPSALPACEAPCKDKPTNSQCTACCLQKPGSESEKNKCLGDSGCAVKP